MSYLNQHARRIVLQKTKGKCVFSLNPSISSQFTPSIGSLHQLNQMIHYQPNANIIPSIKDNTSIHTHLVRMMSTKPPNAEENKSSEESEKPEDDGPKPSEKETAEEEPELTNEEKLEAEVKKLKDALLRSLAEQENTRRIAKRDVESARQFAITSFAKNLLDTADNLSRAMEAVPEDLLKVQQQQDDKVSQTLTTLYEGIKMTEDGLLKAFAKNGLEMYAVVGDVFDPNLHNALYEYPDKEKKPGTIGQVVKKGFSLHGRTIRPAEVGVIKKE